MIDIRRRTRRIWPLILLLLLTLFIDPLPQTFGQAEPTAEPAAEQPLSLLLRGIVVDEAGKPVSGAKLQSLTFKKEDQRQTESLRNGAFVLRIPAEGHYGQAILASDSSGELAGYVGQYDYTTDARELLKIVLRPWKSATLCVIDSQHQPVEGASVHLIIDHLDFHKTATDRQGKVVLRTPADAKVDWIVAYKSGIGFDYYENYSAWPTQDRLQFPERVELKLTGAVAAIIEVRDGDDNPVPGINVLPWSIETEGKISDVNMSGLVTGQTDQNGQAHFDWLPANLKGRITFLVHDDKYYCAINPVYALNTEAVETRTARVQRVATLRGTVRHADGSPAVGIRLQGEGRGATNMYFRGYTRTDAAGKYSIDIYPDQETILAVTDDRYAAESKREINLKPAAELKDLDFTLGLGTLLHGRLTIGEQRQPQPGQTATLVEEAGNQANLVRWYETTDSGEYRFRVGPGTYTLRIADSDPFALTVTNEKEISHDHHIDRLPRGVLTGIVRDDQGEILPDAEIYGESIASPDHAGFTTRSTVDGTFSSERWHDKMLIYASAAQQKQAGFKLIEAADTHMSIECAPAGSLSGTVVDSQGEPLPKRRVTLNMSATGVGANFRMITETDDKGNYSFPAVAVGMQGEVAAPLLLGPGQIVEFKLDRAEDLRLATIVDDSQ